MTDATFVANTDITMTFTAHDEDGEIIGLAGASITWGMKKSDRDSIVLAQKTVGSGITITDAVNGIFTVDLEPEDTEDLSGLYIAEAKVVTSAGKLIRLWKDNNKQFKVEFKKNII